MTAEKGYHRRVFHISAYDSPNVRLGMEQVKRGIQPTNKIIVPGVISYEELQKRLATWDSIRVRIGIEGHFYDGAELLLYPPQWLDRAEKLAEYYLQKTTKRYAESIGIDCGEGVADTVMIAGDRMGIIEAKGKKTPDPNQILTDAMEFIKRHSSVPHDRVVADLGGGGRWLASMLRQKGYNIRTVAFGSTPIQEIKRGRTFYNEKVDVREDKGGYTNLRSQMFYELREWLDPTLNHNFSIPKEYMELRRQMSPIPLWYDAEGRIYLPPKQLRSDQRKGRLDDNAQDKTTLNKLIGCSPDWVDALVLTVHGMRHKAHQLVAGVLK